MHSTLLILLSLIARILCTTTLVAADSPKVVKSSLYGWAPGGIAFSHGPTPGATPLSRVRMTCHSGGRLDYIRIEYLDKFSHVVGVEQLGDPSRGEHIATHEWISASLLISIRPYICGAGKHNGKVCALVWDEGYGHDEFVCGNTSPSLGQKIIPMTNDRFQDGYHFRSFYGETLNQGQFISKIGWFSLESIHA